jgi:hypothetical protein
MNCEEAMMMTLFLLLRREEIKKMISPVEKYQSIAI